MHTQTLFGVILGLSLFLGIPARLGAATTYYNFQQYSGNGVAGPIGTGSIQFSNNSTTVKGNIIKGIGTFTDNLVIYIDTTPGGFTSTTPLLDKNTILEIAISGNNVNHSVINFAPGFDADYAIVLGINNGSAIYKLVNDSTGPHLEQVRLLTLGNADNGNNSSFNFQFDWTDLGLPSRNTNFFKFESSYITSTGSRNGQSYEDFTGSFPFRDITFTNYDTYGVPPVPENTNVALAVFGGLVLTFGVGKRVRCYRKFKRSSP